MTNDRRHRNSQTRWTPAAWSGLLLVGLGVDPAGGKAGELPDPKPGARWLQATAFAVPRETAPDGEGYFSIVEGHNECLYIGTHANGVNSWLVEFRPRIGRMRVVVDAHKAIGIDRKGFGSQAKIHTRNNVGKSGKIYFGTKQGYPAQGEKREDYPGGYPMVYDPETGRTRVYPIPIPHEGIISITPDEELGVAYLSTCSDRRPGPQENAHFLVLDLEKGTYRDLIDTHHIYGFIVVDRFHRAYHPMLGGDVLRYDPRSNRLERLKQTIDGKTPAPATHLADPEGHPINWDISPDGKTLYSLPMSTNQLFAYDLTSMGDTLPGRSLGALITGAAATDCRAMCVGPTGMVWAAITESRKDAGNLLHLVSYHEGDKMPRDHGSVAIRNPDYAVSTDSSGKPLPYPSGMVKLADGTITTRHVILGVCQARNGDVFALALAPYTVLRVDSQEIR
jgi:sugar lactone lactonase YvrE